LPLVQDIDCWVATSCWSSAVKFSWTRFFTGGNNPRASGIFAGLAAEWQDSISIKLLTLAIGRMVWADTTVPLILGSEGGIVIFSVLESFDCRLMFVSL
jgi:hypothetical protein